MAITASTLRSDFSGFLTPEMSAPIFERAARASVVQQVSPQQPMGPEGKSVPVFTGRLTAGWVDEGGEKPKSAATVTLKTLVPKKMSVIFVVSKEVVRANPGSYMQVARNQAAEAFAEAFDRAALHDEGPTGIAGAGPFATYIDQTTKSNELGANTQANGGLYKDLVDSMEEIISDDDDLGRGREVTGWVFDSRMETRLLGQVDTTGRPIWDSLPTDDFAPGLARRGSVLQRPSFMGHGVKDNTSKIMGYAGDWSQTAWGVVGGISYNLTDVGAVTINGQLVSTFEHNLVAILAEAEYAFLVNDPKAFIQLRNDSGS